MSTKRRHDFPIKVIRTLERRVNGRCSNPDHRVPTSGPNTTATTSTSIGQAAHICAASPEGPRYDPSMSKTERTGIENAIWLCNNCAKMIDADPERFPVGLLKNWKVHAELSAKGELGRPPVSRSEFDLMRSLALGDTAKLPVANAVSSICRMTVEEMQRNDPRFVVEVEYANKQTRFTYKPIEPVSICLNVNEPFAPEFSDKFFQLVQHGRDVEITSKAISLEGSPLFEVLNNMEGQFVLRSNARNEATISLDLFDDDSQTSDHIAEIHGETVGGTKSFTFSGSCFGGIFRLEMGFEFGSGEVSTTAEINLDIWQEKPVTLLSHFDKVLRMYNAFCGESKLRLSIDIGGHHVATGFGKLTGETARNILTLLRYIRNVRAVSSHLGIPISFSSNLPISSDDFELVQSIYERLQLQDIKGLAENPRMEIAPRPGKAAAGAEALTDSKMNDFIIEEEFVPLEILGQKLPALKMVTTFSKVLLHPTGKTNGESVEIEVIPDPDSLLSTQLTAV